MSYVHKVLQPGERVLVVGNRHWIYYVPGIVLVLAGAVLWGLDWRTGREWAVPHIIGTVLAAFGLILLIRAWYDQWITEIAVTDKRIIYKRGLLRRETEEMNLDKVETVMVRQSILGRILGYGTVDVRGTGEGIQDLRGLSSPLDLRSAILAR
jgi:uncharacterized membrane protein YdbT with pleckstrin-like domain